MYLDPTLFKANVSGYRLAPSGMTVDEFKEQAIKEQTVLLSMACS